MKPSQDPPHPQVQQSFLQEVLAREQMNAALKPPVLSKARREEFINHFPGVLFVSPGCSR